MKLLRTELKIYRGTYAQIKEADTVDMAMYFAWDTREIFMGNALGVKVPYNGGENLTTNQVIQLIDDRTSTELTQIRGFLTQNNINYNTATQNAANALSIAQGYDATLEAKVAESMATMQELLENAELGDNYFNKTEIEGLLEPLATSASLTTLRNNIYTKLDIDNMGLNDIASDIEFQAYKNTIVPYLAITILPNEYSEANLSSLLDGETLADGIYRIQTSENGYMLLTIAGDGITRIKSDGTPQSYDLNTSLWVDYLNPLAVLSVNEIEPVNGNVTLTVDNIDESSTKRWNSLLPQTDAGFYENAVNPRGRNIAEAIGDNSVAFGYYSSAQAENSVAIGSLAVVDAADAIQLGTGINNIDNSFNVFSYQLLDPNGHIPQERIVERFYETIVTILLTDWNGTKQFIKTLPNMTADAMVWVSPTADDYNAYGNAGLRAITQGLNSLTFECNSIPSQNISVNVVWRV